MEIERAVARDGLVSIARDTDLVGFAWTGRKITLRLDGHLMHAIADDALIGTWPCPVRLLDAVTGRMHHILSDGTYSMVGIAIAPVGRWLATINSGGVVQIWDATSGGEIRRLSGGATGLTSVAIAPDGSWLATTGFFGREGEGDDEDDDGDEDEDEYLFDYQRIAARVLTADHVWDMSVQIWDIESGQMRNIDAGGDVTNVVIAPGGQWLTTTSADRITRIWDTHSSDVRPRTLLGHTDSVTGVAIAPDARWLATTSKDRTVRIWDTATGSPIRTIKGGSGAGLAIAPDGNWISTIDDDGTVRIRQPTSGECVALMRTDDSLRFCVWMPDSSALVVGGNRGLYLFDFKDGE